MGEAIDKPDNTDTSDTPEIGLDWAGSVLDFGRKAMEEGLKLPEKILDETKGLAEGFQTLVGAFATDATMRFHDRFSLFSDGNADKVIDFLKDGSEGV